MTITPIEHSEIVKVDVSQPKLHNCRGSKFVDYEISIETNNKAFFRKYSSVRRRYSDFCWLRAKLSSTEINGFGRDRSIPCLPPKSYFSRFTKVVVDSRQKGFQEFLTEIVKVNDFLSFAGLHLFLQTQLPVQEIDGFLEGKYGENASVEELMSSQDLSNGSEEDKMLQACSSEKCTLLTYSDCNIASSIDIPATEDDDANSEKSLSDSYNCSNENASVQTSSSVESSSFMYTVYR